MEAMSSSKSITNISQPGFFSALCTDSLDSLLFSSLFPLGEKYEIDVEGCLSGEYEDGVMEDVFLDVTDELFLLGGYLILLEEVPTVAKLSSSSQKSEEYVVSSGDDKAL